VIDALVGIGGNEHPRGVLAILLEKISQTKIFTTTPFTTKPFTIAIDAPTGLNAETGKAHQHCIRADITITLAALKTGLLLNDARDVCGEIVVVPIGIPEHYIAQQASIYRIIPQNTATAAWQLLAEPRRWRAHQLLPQTQVLVRVRDLFACTRRTFITLCCQR
jgi:hypothetical protein